MPVDPRIVDLLVRYEELREAGQAVTPEDVCADCPELLEGVRRGIRRIDRLDRLIGQTEMEGGPRAAAGAAPAPLPEGLFAGLRYRPVGFLAGGGCGEVHVAEDDELGRRVALKRIRERHADDEEMRRRFLREAQITARLQHPGIVPVHSLLRDAAGRPFYTMRLIEGKSFKDAIEEFHDPQRQAASEPGARRLALRELLGRFVTVCNTVAYAHQRGVIHRDLKPGNVMLGDYGETLVVDWGLAKVLGTAEPAAGNGTPPAAGDDGTQPGQVVGTPAFMSPEQAAGDWHHVGPTGDVYSLGAILYTLLTGRVPFTGGTAEEVLRQVRAGRLPRPRQVSGAVPAALEAVCKRAMALGPEDRYPTARALADDVERWLADEPVTAYREPSWARLARWGRRHRPVVVGAAALLLTAVVALAIGIVAVNHQREQKEEALQAEARRRKQAREALDALSSRVIDQWLARQKELLPEHKEFLEKTLASYEEFARDTGQNEPSRAGVAAAWWRVGLIRWQLRQAKDAEAAYRRSEELYKRLAADYPDRPEYPNGWARTLDSLGNLLSNTDRPDEAQKTHHAALEIQARLAADRPDEPEYRRELARSHNNLGILLMNTNRPKEAETAYRAALKLRRRLVADFPDQPDYRSELADTHNSLGILLSDTGRPKQAETAYRAALALHKRLAADFPGRPMFRAELARTYNNLGTLLTETGRPPGAEEAYRAALALNRQLASEFPNRPDYRKELARGHSNLAVILKETGRTGAAEAEVRDARALLKRLAADFPAVAEYQAGLANALNGLAELANGRRQYAAACRLLAEALPACRAALRSNARHPLHRGVFRENRQTLAEARLGLGEHARAAAAAEEAAASGYDPGNDLAGAARVLARCVALTEKDAQLSENKRRALARGYADRAMVLLRQAVAKGYQDAEGMKKDKALDALRPRADFQELLAGLTRKKGSAAKK
jgi:serine/threonine-protein kinase